MEAEQQYKKKVEILNSASVPNARGARCKRVRNLANLSRKEMCDDSVLNINTLKGWELGRYGGLPRDGAQKIIKRVAREGVVCTAEWLLHGTGQAPQVDPSQMTMDDMPKAASESYQPNDIKTISNELAFFQKQLANAVWLELSDDGMLPSYELGDYVAGVKCFAQDIDKLLTKDCILQLDNGELLCRNLQCGTIENKYNIVCINPKSTVLRPVLYNEDIIFAASVIFHRRVNY